MCADSALAPKEVKPDEITEETAASAHVLGALGLPVGALAVSERATLRSDNASK